MIVRYTGRSRVMQNLKLMLRGILYDTIMVLDNIVKLATVIEYNCHVNVRVWIIAFRVCPRVL